MSARYVSKVKLQAAVHGGVNIKTCPCKSLPSPYTFFFMIASSTDVDRVLRSFNEEVCCAARGHRVCAAYCFVCAVYPCIYLTDCRRTFVAPTTAILHSCRAQKQGRTVRTERISGTAPFKSPEQSIGCTSAVRARSSDAARLRGHLPVVVTNIAESGCAQLQDAHRWPCLDV